MLVSQKAFGVKPGPSNQEAMLPVIRLASGPTHVTHASPAASVTSTPIASGSSLPDGASTHMFTSEASASQNRLMHMFGSGSEVLYSTIPGLNSVTSWVNRFHLKSFEECSDIPGMFTGKLS